MLAAFALTAAAAALSAVRAAPNPTSPSAETVVNVGSPITAIWDKDANGNWTDMTIQLMTGGNLAMVPLTTVGRNIDATELEQFVFDAPDVSPNAAIYFLQFTSSNEPDETLWTTRFTIAGADGSVTEPTNATQSDGQAIPWGTGRLNQAYDNFNSSSSMFSGSSTRASSSAASSSASSASVTLSSSASVSQTGSRGIVASASNAAAAASSSAAAPFSAGERAFGPAAGVAAFFGAAGAAAALF